MSTRLSILGLATLALACGQALAPAPRAALPGVDPVSGALASVEVELPAAELSSVRGPAGAVLLGVNLETHRLAGGFAPDCAFSRTPSGALAPVSARCAWLLGGYATLERARAFLLSAGAEALAPALVLADPRTEEELAPGLHYLQAEDAFTLSTGPAGARVPAALNPGAVARESARRQLRTFAEQHPDEAEGIALFLGAAASGDPGYLAASDSLGDPRGELDLSRPLALEAPAPAVLAGALWAWADASGDLVSASRAALAASRALSSSRDHDAGPDSLLSLVAEQLNGHDRDQACAVFRSRAGRLAACP